MDHLFSQMELWELSSAEFTMKMVTPDQHNAIEKFTIKKDILIRSKPMVIFIL